jgi:hypothetical protein
MKIFKELKKLGYKHYTEHTVEELDALEINSSHRIMEQALVLKWFRDMKIRFFIKPSLTDSGVLILYSQMHNLEILFMLPTKKQKLLVLKN